MIRYFIYFPMHLVGILLVFAAVGGLAFCAWRNPGATGKIPGRKTFLIFHIVGLLLILTGGFGLMKVIGIKHASIYPNWVFVKFTIWTVLCFASVLIHRLPRHAPLIAVVFVALGAFSATTGKFKQAVVPDRPVSTSP